MREINPTKTGISWIRTHNLQICSALLLSLRHRKTAQEFNPTSYTSEMERSTSCTRRKETPGFDPTTGGSWCSVQSTAEREWPLNTEMGRVCEKYENFTFGDWWLDWLETRWMRSSMLGIQTESCRSEMSLSDEHDSSQQVIGQRNNQWRLRQ